jgi:hypothetical protein
MPEARVFRRAGRGKSAPPVRRGESEAQPYGCHSLSYSTGSDWSIVYAQILPRNWDWHAACYR